MIILFVALTACQAQNRITARATSYDISDNLDLKAVATIFGESRDLEEFEYRLNDPELQISNLDLNRDGYVDYLRVVESNDDGISEVVIQAVLDDDVYQDVATIDVERVHDGNLRVQIIGDAYLYGPDYVFEPVFVRTPIIFSFFWGPAYHPWRSPYYWGHYPARFHYWRPYATPRYIRNVNVHIYAGNTYNFNVSRRISFPGNYHNTFRRDDYARRYPDHSFNHRHEGVKNKTELYRRRPNNVNYERRTNDRQIQRQRPETYKSNQERRAVERQPERRMIEKRTSEPIRQPRKENVIKQPNRRIETTKKSTVTTRKTETAPDRTRSRATNQVKTNRKTQKKQETTNKKSNYKPERRRRTE